MFKAAAETLAELSADKKYLGAQIGFTEILHTWGQNLLHGHDVGDDVLRMVASKLERVTGGGKAFRYGGEEFVIASLCR